MQITDFRRVDVGSIPFSSTDLTTAADWFLAETRARRRGLSVRLINAYLVMVADQDRDYRDLVRQHGVNMPDGMSIARAMALLGAPEARQVRGPSFFVTVIERGLDAGIRHFFVGATEETLRAMAERMRKRWPNIQIAGLYSPPFAPYSDALVEDIMDRVPEDCDVIWVGLGSPKQDWVSQAIADRTGNACAGVGAAFDFEAGTVPVAPRWIQRVGGEWLFRLVSEPKRLWRRYLFGNTAFMRIVGIQVLRRLLRSCRVPFS